MLISIETTVHAPVAQVWSAWTTPDDIRQWNRASEDWICPVATIDLKVGGKFKYRMEAADGSMGFDFEGTFTSIDLNTSIEYALDDDRKVQIVFAEIEGGTRVVESFEAEEGMAAEQQRHGWQAILNNFKKHVDGTRE